MEKLLKAKLGRSDVEALLRALDLLLKTEDAYMDLSKLEFVDSTFHNTIFPRCNPEVGDVLLTKDGANTGNVTLNSLNEPFSVLSSVCLLKADRRKILPPLLMYYLQSKNGFEQITGKMTGAAIKRIILKTIKNSTIPLPPLSEQQRVVAIIDEAFEGIDTAIANTERNLANARELFDCYLNSVFAQKGDRWVPKKLEDTVEKTCSLSYGIVQPGEDVPGGLPVVRPTDLRSKIVALDGLKRIDPTLADAYKRTNLNGDELLLCVRGGTGSVSIAAKELAGSNVTRGIVPIRFDGSVVIQEFGYFAFISEGVQAQIRAATYGAALMQINIRDLRKVTFDLPPLEVQKDLLEKLSNISVEVEHLASIHEQKAAALAELKQAILRKAFAGELTAHPEKALQEAAE